jgi:tripartite ATP-independent transporter DctM subunit
MVIIFALLAMHQYVAVALGVTGILLLQFVVGGKASMVGWVTWQQLNVFTFVALPLFILMGSVIMHSGLGDRLYRGVSPWVSKLPGGLLHTNIAACAIFAAVSGSSVATAATVGSFAVPELLKRGYDRRAVFGSVVGAGALGLLIPPSLTMIVYAALTGVSIGRLFIGGIVPGIMTAIIFMAYIAIRAILNPSLTPKEPGPSLKMLTLSFRDIWPIALLILVVLGGLYFGVVTAIEVAALGAVMAMVLALVLRRLTWLVLRAAVVDGLRSSGMIVIIIIGAFILQLAWGQLTVPRSIVQLVATSGLPNWVILIAIYVMYLFLGCFFDGASMTVLTIPVVFPLITALGYDPLWFGVTLTMLIEIAQITPPVGLNLFIISAIGKTSVTEVVRGSIPYFFMFCITVALVTLFPEIILWLPSISLAK